MTDEQLPLDNVKELAEEAMAEKTEMVGNEAQSRELWDVPTEPAEVLAEQQAEEEE